MDKGHKRQFALFNEHIRAGGEALIPFESIVNTTRASLACITSLKENRRVEIRFQNKNSLHLQPVNKLCSMNRKDMVWVWTGKRTPAKLEERDKNRLKKIVEAEIEKSEKIKKAVSKIAVKAGRIYFYELFEPSQPEGVYFTVPLIDGKYIETILARITVYNKEFSICTLDYQRYNNEWLTIDEGTLEECIKKIETGGWFDV